MCRCTPSIRTPYCKNCEGLMPRKEVYKKTLPIEELIIQGWGAGITEEEICINAREHGYIVTIGEVEMAIMMIDYVYSESVKVEDIRISKLESQIDELNKRTMNQTLIGCEL